MLKTVTTLFATGLLFLCQVSMSHATADSLFLSIAGIKGESGSGDIQHPGWFTPESVSWGHGEAPPGSPSKIQFGRVQIVKRLDSTSATLALLGATAQPIKDIKLEITRSNGTPTPLVVFRMKLTNARVASYVTTAAYNINATESVHFSFDTISWITFTLNEQGLLSPGSSACYDVLNNKICAPSF